MVELVEADLEVAGCRRGVVEVEADRRGIARPLRDGSHVRVEEVETCSIGGSTNNDTVCGTVGGRVHDVHVEGTGQKEVAAGVVDPEAVGVARGTGADDADRVGREVGRDGSRSA